MALKNEIKKCAAVLLLAVILVAAVPVYADNSLNAKHYAEYEEMAGTYSIDDNVPDYKSYKNDLQNTGKTARPADEYNIDAANYISYTVSEESNEPQILNAYEGIEGDSLFVSEDALVEYTVDIKTEGSYDISMLYYPVEGNNAAIQRSIFVDGMLPYKEMALIEFSRMWTNNIAEWADGMQGVRKAWDMDNQGNDLKPTMYEIPQWIQTSLYDSNGYITEALSVYFTEGRHTIAILSLREPMILRAINLKNEEREESYGAVLSKWDSMGFSDSRGEVIRIEAENANRTTSQMLYPTQDQSSPSIYPSSEKELKNNTIGGNSWRLPGQVIEWDFDVPESGYYNIALHDKQNFQKGIYVSRKITIDGKTPFEEFSDYGFVYKQNWRLEVLENSGGEAYKVYLEAGRHTIGMQAVLGNFSDMVSVVQDAVYDLNSIYRKVIRIIGVKPDSYRDYQIEASLPNLESELIEVRDKLDWTIAELKKTAKNASDKERVLVSMRDQLNELIEDQERFTKVIASFRINVRACGTWITQVISQPLQLDAIYIYSPDKEIKAENDSVFSKIAFEIKRLFYSFVIDYNKIGNVVKDEDNAKSITLWIGSGRDQANVIKSLIDERFTKESGVAVNVMLVDMSTLLQATLAGQGPDVAVQVGNDVPMNYGLRDAVADLSQFSDLNEIKTRFHQSAFEAFEFGKATYALPETQTFPMMFYRKDILKELGISVPKTWDDVKVVMSVLAKNQMEFAMLPDESIFAMLLYQNGGKYYNEDATLSALDSDEAVNAFKEYCEYYSDYKLDKITSAEERFRTGEAPIIINDYGLYSNLQVSAPDIKGLWGFAPVPGVMREDGSIDNTVASTGGACVVMEASADKASSWEFLKWWTSADTQTNFGREMESLMGAAARVPTANIEAFGNMPWPVTDYKALMEQFTHVSGIPQVPGGYFTYRNVDNAFYSVSTPATERSMTNKVIEVASPREELMDRVILINDEIRYKRVEFGLPIAQEAEGKQ